jgi:hypothetical protein
LFFEDLGVPAKELSDERNWDKWIKLYWAHRRTLTPTWESHLHREINRFYYAIQEGWYLRRIDFFNQKKELRQKYLIRRSERNSTKALEWKVVAGAYVEGLKRKAEQKKYDDRYAEFLKNIPVDWLTEMGPDSREKKTPYQKFLIDLSENWSTFLRSYSGGHYLEINASPQSWSLEHWVAGRTPKGDSLYTYHPKPVSLYQLAQVKPVHGTYSSNAEYLWALQQREFPVARQIQMGGAGNIEKLRKQMPQWLMMGDVLPFKR